MRLTPEQREERRRERWRRVIDGQRRPGNTVPKVDDVADDFRARFGGTATESVTTDRALLYFGLREGFTRADLKSAFRRKIMVVHPDHGGSVAEAQRCISIYDVLEGRI